MAESGNANSKSLARYANVGGGGDDGGGGGGGGEDSAIGSSSITSSGINLDHKAQVTDGPVIRMGMGAVTSRRDPRNYPDSLPMKGQGQGVMATWKDVSPPKEKRNLLDLSQKECISADGGEEGSCEEKNRNAIRTNPYHESVGSFRGTDANFQSVKRFKTDSAAEIIRRFSVTSSGQDNSQIAVEEIVVEETVSGLTTWRDVSPTKPHDGRKKRPESGYFSNDVQSEGCQESREEIDSSLSDSDSGRRDRSNSSATAGGGEEGFHSSDYFYEDEFSVQFDTNLREVVVISGEPGAPDEQVALPQSLNGSYTKLRDSLQPGDLYLGPYESELSGSRESMEISSSEREMMCSSDMLNFSKDPLFTPSPPPGDHVMRREQQQQLQTVSLDSLGHQGQGHGCAEMGGSVDPNFAVHCSIRKDAYFLSFNGSQQKSTSESDISYVSQVSSNDGHQSGGNQSDSSQGQDAEDEGSKSNSYDAGDDGKSPTQPDGSSSSTPAAFYRPVRNMLLSRYPGRICLEALQDYLLSRSSSSKSAGSSRHSCSGHCKLSPLCGTLLSSGDLFMSGGHRRGMRRSSNLTTWKQVKNLKQLGKQQNIHDLSNSMPDLTAEDVKVVRREKKTVQERTVESIAESFHGKRHSAYILELYQRLMSSSNPPDPQTLSRIDHILFHEPLPKEEYTAKKDCGACPSCGITGANKKHDFHLDLRRDVPCGRSLCSATTSMSPQALTLWHGQKNFGSQFPPNTTDCGVQASMGEPSPPLNSRSMQTSPGSPGADILHALHEMQMREPRSSHKRCEKPSSMTRAKSATECCIDTHADRLKAQMRRTVSLSPSRIGMNSFYTHKSLPDLSFLGGPTKRMAKSRESSSPSSVSLFDPVQIPIILTPVLEDGSRSRSSSHSQSRSSTSSGCVCGKENQASTTRRRRRNSSGCSGTSTSSGSGHSLSCSSGIEPGYVEPRSLGCLAPELEHLLFYPPHLESAYHQLGLSETRSRVSEKSAEGEGGEAEGGETSPTQRCPNTKIDRYANEAHPCSGQAARAKTTQRCSNAGSSNLTPDRLDALKEEKTPSPEPSYCHYPARDYTDHRCFACQDASEGESSQELDEEKFMMYQRWLQDRKPPLKSCLKRCERDHRARSLSTLSCREKMEPTPEKPPRKQNRHSIACDGMMPVLVDEEGFKYTQVTTPCPQQYAQQLQCCNHTAAAPVTQEYAGEKVVLRRKKPAPTISEGLEGGGSIDDSMRAKRVSFASEVSFHSPNYTPQCSPRRQQGEGELTAVQMEDDILTLHVVRRNRGLPHCIDPDKDVNTALESRAPTDIKAPVTTTAEPSGTPALSPWEQKACVVRGVIQAAEALLQHFSGARDPFDKMRLGSTHETAEVGALVVTNLCPAIERVVRDGMKPCMTGLHIFGKIQLSPWRVTESSAELGPYTRAIHDLVKQLKLRPNLVSHRQKFYAFLAGLLNLRLLDFWMGYITTKENFTGRFYDDDAILCAAHSTLERQYQDMLLALQPLAVLPFQVDYDIVATHSLADSSYMGESDIEHSSPKKQELSSSPKIVIARTKNRAGTSPNRASWAGPTNNRQDTSLDISATWDWIKNTTLPKARSLMTDMGLMSSTTSVTTSVTSTAVASVTAAPAVTKSTAANAALSVKTSRLSQDLASVGIVTSRQNISISGSTSSPNLKDCFSQKDEEMEEARPSSYPGERPQRQQALPAVIVDHGTQRIKTTEVSAARQRAEEILRRKGDISPQRRLTRATAVRSESAENKDDVAVGMKFEEKKQDPLRREDGKDQGENVSSSPQRIVAESPQKKLVESSPIQIQNSPTRKTDSPNRQTGSPSCQNGSPSRQSGSPNRGPLINPGSPKYTVAGSRDKEGAEVINRRASKVALDDFPEDDDSTITITTSKAATTLSSSFTTVSNAAQKLLPKKEDKVYREGKTDYSFDMTAQSPKGSNPPTPTTPTASSSTATSPTTGQAAAPQNANAGRTSKLSGLKRLSPRGSFNIISFFDRLLLPSEKATTAGGGTPTAAAGKTTVTTLKESEWDSTEQASSVATVTSSSASSSVASPTPPESLHTSSSTSNNSSPRAKVPKSSSKTSLGRGSRIPKRQSGSPVAKKPETKYQHKTSAKTETTTTTPKNIPTRRTRPKQTPEPIPVVPTTTTQQRTNRSETPEVDINANSPEFHPSQEEVFVEHNPIGHWGGGSSSETGQSDGSGDSVSMEEDQSRHASPAKCGTGVPVRVTAAFK
ncbi:uncharacterized protein [Littorina saxatilis]